MKYQFQFSASYCIKKSPDGKYFATIGGSVVLWDAGSGKKIISFSQIKNPDYLSFSHAGRMLAVKNTSGKIALFDLESMCHLFSLQPTKSEGCGLCFTPDDRYVVSADWEGTVYAVDVAQKSAVILKKGPLMYHSLEFKGDRMIFHGTRYVRNRSHSFFEFRVYPFDEALTTAIESKTEFDTVTFTADCGKCAAADNYKKAVLIMDQTLTHTFNVITTHSGKRKKARIEYAAWSPDRKRLALIGQYSDHHAIQVIDMETLIVIASYELPYACYAEFTDDGTQLLIGTWQKGYCIDVDELQQEGGIPELSSDELQKQIEANGLSAQLLRQVSEAELLEALFAVSDDLIMKTAKRLNCDEAEALKAVPELNRLVYLLYWFDNETSEGGLSQYMDNSRCELCGALKDAFELLDMPQHAAILDRAQQLYRTGCAMDDDAWTALDAECEALDESPLAVLYEYLEKTARSDDEGMKGAY
jgi:6-phosphogluconolactonase (cycloisomerase 2 family)